MIDDVLSQLDIPEHDDLCLGLNVPDDAVVLSIPPGKLLLQAVDFFHPFVDDPYIFGQITANHALSDIYTMGGEPRTTLAVATVPSGIEEKVTDELLQMTQGATKVLNEAHTALVGGHTCEGSELSLGFTVNGQIDRDKILKKGGMQVGDQLILTKVIGTGTLFAAEMPFNEVLPLVDPQKPVSLSL